MTTDQPVHAFLAFEPGTDKALAREIALQLANYYFKKDLSRNGWKREGKQTCIWEAPRKEPDGTTPYVRCTSPLLHLSDISKALESGTFVPEALGLPAPACYWLDSSIEMSPHFHAVGSEGGEALTFLAEPNLGPKFPIVPAVEREGKIFTSFQTIVIRRLASLRDWLVQNSQQPDSEEWFQNLRNLVSECVSLVDNTLHQLYFKAEFDPLPTWAFDRAGLGVRHGVRMQEKLRWVRQITGRDLQCQMEVEQFIRLRELRNHLHHFDPPSFAYTFQEVATWLNHVLGVARLVWRIRSRASALPSVPLINLMLRRRVLFLPIHAEARRTTHPGWSGYRSTTWSLSPRPRLDGTPGRIVLRALPPIRIV